MEVVVKGEEIVMRGEGARNGGLKKKKEGGGGAGQG